MGPKQPEELLLVTDEIVADDKENSLYTNGSSSYTSGGIPNEYLLSKEEAEYAVESLRELLRFQTVSVTASESGEYRKCAEYLMSELKSLSCCLDNIHILEESPPDSPVVVARWRSWNRDADVMPVILLNSHYDVVPAVVEDWTVPPFEGVRRDGKIYGRGVQDMKSVCIQYIEAIRKLHTSLQFTPRRHVYLTFVPDEEVGGAGMAAFLSSKLYQQTILSKHNGIALALDEGLASETDSLSVFYGERVPWWINVEARGRTGHGSRFIEHTAIEQLIDLCNKALAFRNNQRDLLHGYQCSSDSRNCSHAVAAANRRQKNKMKQATLGDVTSLNITSLQAGVKVADTFVHNVVPPTASCSMDIRISPKTHPSEIRTMLDEWCRECSTSEGDLSWGFVEGTGNDDTIGHNLTSMDPVINPWYAVFLEALNDEMNIEVEPEVFPAATDSRFLRALGIRALGFSPMRKSEILLHENDEYIKESVFVEGCSIMACLVKRLASQGPDIDILAASAQAEESL